MKSAYTVKMKTKQIESCREITDFKGSYKLWHCRTYRDSGREWQKQKLLTLQKIN